MRHGAPEAKAGAQAARSLGGRTSLSWAGLKEHEGGRLGSACETQQAASLSGGAAATATAEGAAAETEAAQRREPNTRRAPRFAQELHATTTNARQFEQTGNKPSTTTTIISSKALERSIREKQTSWRAIMRASHKIALALGALLLLAANAYFLISHLAASSPASTNGTSTSAPPPPTRVTESLVAAERASASTQQQQQQQSLAPISTTQTTTESSTPNSTLNFQTQTQTPSSTQSSTQSSTSIDSSTSGAGEPLSGAPTNGAQNTSQNQNQSQNQAEREPSATTATATTAATASSEQQSIEQRPTSNALELYTQVSSQPIEFYDISERERQLWQEFKQRHQKSYTSEQEEARRLEVFVANGRFIEAFNRLPGRHFELAMNHLGDMTRDEINERHIGPLLRWPANAATATAPASSLAPPPAIKILAAPEGQPSSDWRHLLASAPADQGLCRESAVFAASAALEAKANALASASNQSVAQAAMTTNGAPVPPPAFKLSEPQLLDCLATSGARVCAGELGMGQVFEFLQRVQPLLATAADYANYQQARTASLANAGAQQAAAAPPAAPVCDIFTAGLVQRPAELRPLMSAFSSVHRENLDEALQNIGPLVVALDASQPTFHFYKSGIYEEINCSSDSYNMHALLVGQQPGDEQTGAHYTLRASLGPNWGEGGHMRLSKDLARNRCLPQNYAIYPELVLV